MATQIDQRRNVPDAVTHRGETFMQQKGVARNTRARANRMANENNRRVRTAFGAQTRLSVCWTAPLTTALVMYAEAMVLSFFRASRAHLT